MYVLVELEEMQRNLHVAVVTVECKIIIMQCTKAMIHVCYELVIPTHHFFITISRNQTQEHAVD